MSTYTCQGIILKKTDRGEADQIFSIYSDQKGKVIALGRATKKIESKLNYNLQPLTVVELMIVSGKNYDHIAGAVIAKNFSKIRGSLKKVVLASFALELVDKLTKPDSGDQRIFSLLVKYFSALENNLFTNKEWQVVRQAFVVKLLSLLGFDPPTDIENDRLKLDNFLKNHLDSELKTDKFFL